MFQQLDILKHQIMLGPSFFTIDEGYFPFAFHFNQPINIEDITRLNRSFVGLPTIYIEFLQIHNGAVLFLDDRYGQWGIKIHGSRSWQYNFPSYSKNPKKVTVADIFELNQEYQDMTKDFLLFGSFAGDLDLLAFRIETSNGKNYSESEVYIIQELDTRSAKQIAPSYSSWLDKTILNKGEKWWEK